MDNEYYDLENLGGEEYSPPSVTLIRPSVPSSKVSSLSRLPPSVAPKGAPLRYSLQGGYESPNISQPTVLSDAPAVKPLTRAQPTPAHGLQTRAQGSNPGDIVPPSVLTCHPNSLPLLAAQQKPLGDIVQNGAIVVSPSLVRGSPRRGILQEERISPAEKAAFPNIDAVVEPFTIDQLYNGAAMHVEKNAPRWFRLLQFQSGITIHANQPGAFLTLVTTINEPTVHEKTKENIEKSVANFVVHGFEYPCTAYAPAAVEFDVLMDTNDEVGWDPMKQWDIHRSQWVKKHRTNLGNLIEYRKEKFEGTISEERYNRITNLKNARLTYFSRKIEREALKELTDFLARCRYSLCYTVCTNGSRSSLTEIRKKRK